MPDADAPWCPECGPTCPLHGQKYHETVTQSAENDAGPSDPQIDRQRGHDDVIGLLRAAARHPHKGPRDTDASMLLAAAKRLRGGYEPGGSNTKQTVARVCELVAALIEDTPIPPGETP
jgi:hypothetical protein